MQLAELDNLYNELKAKEEITITPDCVISVLENESTTLSIDKIVDKIVDSIEVATTVAAAPKFSNRYNDTELTMGSVFDTALNDCFAERDLALQTHKLNRILFPVMLREGMSCTKNGMRVNATPDEMLAFFHEFDAAPGLLKHDSNYMFFSKPIPVNISASCATIKIRHLPPNSIQSGLKAYMRKTATGAKIVLWCEELQPFTPSPVAMHHYNRLEMKLVKTRQGPKLVSWAIGIHPDHPYTNEIDRVCLLGKQAIKK
jgi:hypothetical protein